MMLTRETYRAIKQKSKSELEAYLERIYTRAFEDGRSSAIGRLTVEEI